MLTETPEYSMPETAPNNELLRSLGRLARGLSALFWGLPHLLPGWVPLAVRLWIALVGAGLLFLFARLDVWALFFRVLGFPVEKLFANPIASTTLGDKNASGIR